MNKHSRKFKLKVARLRDTHSISELSRKFGVSEGQVHYWHTVYRLNGEDSFKPKKLPHTESFKLEVIQKMHEEEWSVVRASAFFDLSSSGLLSLWLKEYTKGGILSLVPLKPGISRMKKESPDKKSFEQMTREELREELEYLRAENAVLKKLKALTQKKKTKTVTKP